MSIRAEGGCVSSRVMPPAKASAAPLARSPIPPGQPVAVVAGWEVSAVRASGDLTLTDCTPLAKLLLRAPADGLVAGELAVPFGRAARDQAGVLLAGQVPGEQVSVIDLTHGRALMRLSGPTAATVLSAVCGVDLSDSFTPDG